MINLLNIFKKSKEIPTVEAVSKEETEDISEMQRQKAYLSLEARRENHEILKIERERKKIERQIELESARADLQSLKEELYGEDETEDENNDKEMLILKMVNKFLNPQTPLNPLTPTNNFPIEKEGALIDDITLNKIKDKLPKEIKDYLINIDVGSLLKLKKNIELET